MMIGVVVALSFVVLMLAFGSLVVPAKAAVMNLLSVGAAYGVVDTAVFQNGHGATAIGLDQAIPIVSFVPLLMFAILFGLSMDYEVFLLSQIQEHYRATGRPVRAVIDGLANTGRVITSAALIMVCVFTSFVLDGDPVVKEFGVGLAVAIGDATLVRCLLVPAVMTLLGKASWWMPVAGSAAACRESGSRARLLHPPAGPVVPRSTPALPRPPSPTIGADDV